MIRFSLSKLFTFVFVMGVFLSTAFAGDSNSNEPSDPMVQKAYANCGKSDRACIQRELEKYEASKKCDEATKEIKDLASKRGEACNKAGINCDVLDKCVTCLSDKSCKPEFTYEKSNLSLAKSDVCPNIEAAYREPLKSELESLDSEKKELKSDSSDLEESIQEAQSEIQSAQLEAQEATNDANVALEKFRSQLEEAAEEGRKDLEKQIQSLEEKMSEVHSQLAENAAMKVESFDKYQDALDALDMEIKACAFEYFDKFQQQVAQRILTGTNKASGLAGALSKAGLSSAEQANKKFAYFKSECKERKNHHARSVSAKRRYDNVVKQLDNNRISLINQLDKLMQELNKLSQTGLSELEAKIARKWQEAELEYRQKITNANLKVQSTISKYQSKLISDQQKLREKQESLQNWEEYGTSKLGMLTKDPDFVSAANAHERYKGVYDSFGASCPDPNSVLKGLPNPKGTK
ncbi:MAG: hypothetical protein H6626_10710 [Pseudobdellovibrionaceae bacterium]|nr:hypothetical protein [Bdellovibrionales bacterium]USN46675.1 MAG: hypothetical protein H6626_10710 [Pseudobdellovibrionaceae bacterium]